ncbi:hypothetical protein AHAS_Ahas09G0176400 [Arachis hypogaea]
MQDGSGVGVERTQRSSDIGKGKREKVMSQQCRRGGTAGCDDGANGILEDRLEGRVCDYVSGSNWDLNHILELLGENWAPIFAATKPPEASFGDDQVAWLHSANGSFSIKSACSIYLETPEDSTASLFLKVWKLNALKESELFVGWLQMMPYSLMLCDLKGGWLKMIFAGSVKTFLNLCSMSSVIVELRTRRGRA